MPRWVMQVCSASITTPTPGVKIRVEALGDLHGQPLLGLRPGGKVLHQAGQFGQPEDALPGQVADVRDAGEEQHVMLAESPERDGASQHQLVIALVVPEGGEPERLRGKQLCVGVGHPGRRGSPFLAVEVDPERGEEVRGGPLRGVQIDDALPPSRSAGGCAPCTSMEGCTPS